MANDNKISIDVTLTDDGQKQTDAYVRSFESLRAAVDGLSQPFNSFSNSLNTLNRTVSNYSESLVKLNAQHKEVSTIGAEVDEKFTKTLNVFSTGIGILKLFEIELKALYISLTGGLAIVTAFLPEIIDFAKALFTGKDAVSAMTLNFKNLNEVTKAANKDASSQITSLQILYKSVTDVRLLYFCFVLLKHFFIFTNNISKPK